MRDHGKKRSSPPVFLKSWLIFRVRGQFEIKILTVWGHRSFTCDVMKILLPYWCTTAGCVIMQI